MDAEAVRAFARRDRSAADSLKRAYWADRFRAEGAEATWAASRALWEYAKRARPDWPTDADRADDLAHHIELKQKIDRAARAFLTR